MDTIPNRIIKESICTSNTLAKISADAERLFWRIVVRSDDYGLYYGDARILTSMCFPLSPPKISAVRGWLNELSECGLVCFYISDNKQYLKVVNWDKHQQIRANKSKFPLPQAKECDYNQLQSDDINCNQLQSDVPVFDNVSVSDIRIRKRHNARQQQCEYAAEFEAFWQAYPRKTEKQKAYRTWKTRCKEGLTTEDLVMAAKNYAAFCISQGTEQKYIKHPATFLGPDRAFLDWTKTGKEEKDAACISDAKDNSSGSRYPMLRVVDGKEYPV